MIIIGSEGACTISDLLGRIGEKESKFSTLAGVIRWAIALFYPEKNVFPEGRKVK